MTKVRKRGEKERYDVRSPRCLGAACFQPGSYQSRGATSSGSRNTGDSTPMCMRRAYHGSPEDDGFRQELNRVRMASGWTVAR
jgi:hypothetical protein